MYYYHEYNKHNQDSSDPEKNMLRQGTGGILQKMINATASHQKRLSFPDILSEVNHTDQLLS